MKTPIMEKSLQGESIVTKIINQITQAIISGEIKPGDKLPTETSLCSSFQVGRNSVREAIKIMEAYGMVYIKRPEGTFVSDSYNQNMLDPMLYGILLQKSRSQEIIELRKVLDIGILQVVMEKSTPDLIENMTHYLDLLEKEVNAPKPSIDAILQADINFHMAITKAANNEMLLSMYSYVDRITEPSRFVATQMALKNKEANDFIALHKQLITIILEKNFQEIDKTLTAHYTFWQQIESTVTIHE